jgi:RNA polymerase sigma-70 factor (ECF subfamily)
VAPALRSPAALAALSDATLARLAAEGRRDAFSELVRRAAPVVGDLLRRMGAQDALADDITQEAMLAAYRAIGSYRGEAGFATWAMRIAGRLYVKRRRKEARWRPMAEPVDPGLEAPGEERRSVARLDLDRALQQLSEPERLCVSLCHGAGMTHDEIAAALQVPLGTVKSHVNRGVKKLRALMRSPSHG